MLTTIKTLIIVSTMSLNGFKCCCHCGCPVCPKDTFQGSSIREEPPSQLAGFLFHGGDLNFKGTVTVDEVIQIFFYLKRNFFPHDFFSQISETLPLASESLPQYKKQLYSSPGAPSAEQTLPDFSLNLSPSPPPYSKRTPFPGSNYASRPYSEYTPFPDSNYIPPPSSNYIPPPGSNFIPPTDSNYISPPYSNYIPLHGYAYLYEKTPLQQNNHPVNY